MSNQAPVKLGMVPFVSVAVMLKIIQKIGLEQLLLDLAACIERDLLNRGAFDLFSSDNLEGAAGINQLQPNCKSYSHSFTYLNGCPRKSQGSGSSNTSLGVLSEASSGHPILFTEMTLLSTLRTAATSALVARYLAPPQANTMAILGDSDQCEFQALAFKRICGIKTVNVFSPDPYANDRIIKNLTQSGLTVVSCATLEAAIKGAGVVTTCATNGENSIEINNEMLAAGVHINNVSDSNAKFDTALLSRANVFVEYAQQARVEGVLQVLKPEHPASEIWQMMTGNISGRVDENQITFFDGIGFVIEDFAALRYLNMQLERTGFFVTREMNKKLAETQDLFGLVSQARH